MNTPTNEAKMTLEEKIVQRLKSDTLMTLVGDEDAITELVRRAVNEALFQPQRVQRSYGGYDLQDSLVVSLAREVAKKAVETVLTEQIEMIKNNETIMAEIHKSMVALLPHAIISSLQSAINAASTSTSINVVSEFANSIQTELDKVRMKL